MSALLHGQFCQPRIRVEAVSKAACGTLLLSWVLVSRSSLSPENFAFLIAKAGATPAFMDRRIGTGGIIQLTYSESMAHLRVLSQSSITLPLPGLRTRFNQSCILSLYNGVNQERLPWKYAVLTCLAACYKVVSCGAALKAWPQRQA